MKNEQLKESFTKSVNGIEFVINGLKEATSHSDFILRILLIDVLRESDILKQRIEQIQYAVAENS